MKYTQPIVNNQIDLRYNWYVENLENSVRQKFCYGLLNKVKAGELICYSSPSESAAISPETVEGLLSRIDTAYVENAMPPHDLQMTIIEEPYQPDDIMAIKFVQDLRYYEDGSIEIDVKWYAPVFYMTDPLTGEMTNTTQTPFWIKSS